MRSWCAVSISTGRGQGPRFVNSCRHHHMLRPHLHSESRPVPPVPPHGVHFCVHSSVLCADAVAVASFWHDGPFSARSRTGRKAGTRGSAANPWLSGSKLLVLVSSGTVDRTGSVLAVGVGVACSAYVITLWSVNLPAPASNEQQQHRQCADDKCGCCAQGNNDEPPPPKPDDGQQVTAGRHYALD